MIIACMNHKSIMYCIITDIILFIDIIDTLLYSNYNYTFIYLLGIINYNMAYFFKTQMFEICEENILGTIEKHY